MRICRSTFPSTITSSSPVELALDDGLGGDDARARLGRDGGGRQDARSSPPGRGWPDGGDGGRFRRLGSEFPKIPMVPPGGSLGTSRDDSGAGDGDRTRDTELGSSYSTAELRPLYRRQCRIISTARGRSQAYPAGPGCSGARGHAAHGAATMGVAGVEAPECAALAPARRMSLLSMRRVGPHPRARAEASAPRLRSAAATLRPIVSARDAANRAVGVRHVVSTPDEHGGHGHTATGTRRAARTSGVASPALRWGVG